MAPFGTANDNNNPSCEHFSGIDEVKMSPRTAECEECEKEGTDWVALRMCLVCGHVGCDSSEGLHATRHFKQTGHPVMVALPSRQWKWCYVHRKYF
jgi:uncharacterized UBP type Zn finger protein